ncbi:hypothetical protein DFR52_11120 [Hoeflea marina]|uniref:Uncharacterized protein n=1 Tax=Hoeflea marina TaxID=274592 RepID=A0A317PCJ4_9HYPH|nr:hypothetical protein [Hoeflea marina]PWV95389.1 hypothetical protein DFR52_11120 [Hoeflea marina]
MQSDVTNFMRQIALLSDTDELDRRCREFMLSIPPSLGLEVAAALAQAHPFYLPPIGAENAARLRPEPTQFSELVMRAKLSCRYSTQLNLLVAAAPDPAADFLAGALRKGIGLPEADLSASTLSPAASLALGQFQIEQQTDELALIRGGMNGLGYVARHALVCTPYLCGQMRLFNVRPVLMTRNLLDQLVLLDAGAVAARAGRADDAPAVPDGLPCNYHLLDDAERLEMLTDLRLGWLLRFFVSWKSCESTGLVEPVWVSGDGEMLAQPLQLARRIAGQIGHEAIVADLLTDALLEPADELRRPAVGASPITPQLRDRIHAICCSFEADIDLSPILESAVV